MITQEELIKIIKETPNDMELGATIRQLFFKFKTNE